MPSRRAFRERMIRPAPALTLAPLALDPLSAATARAVGFDTIYLGGGGLGYLRATTEALLTTTEVAEACRAITERVDVHVVVDGGVGFGDAVHMARAIRMVEQAGAAGIEIEDQVAPKRAHHHKGVEHLVPAEEMVGRIKAALDARTDRDFVVIVRCNAISHEGVQAALERSAAYEEAGADMLMLFPRGAEEQAAVSKGTKAPLAAMSIGRTQPDSELLAAGYALDIDPMSATVLGFRAIKEGYERLKAGPGFGVPREEIMATMREVGETIGVQALYDIEARTTERDHYLKGGH